jgi:hypothetical protein
VDGESSYALIAQRFVGSTNPPGRLHLLPCMSRCWLWNASWRRFGSQLQDWIAVVDHAGADDGVCLVDCCTNQARLWNSTRGQRFMLRSCTQYPISAVCAQTHFFLPGQQPKMLELQDALAQLPDFSLAVVLLPELNAGGEKCCFAHLEPSPAGSKAEQAARRQLLDRLLRSIVSLFDVSFWSED